MTTVITGEVVEVDVTGAQGPRGADAAPPARVQFIATAGQTTFPATGDFGDLDPPFSYLESPLVVIVNGVIIPSSDYVAPGGTAPIVFTTPMEGGEVVSFHSFLLVGDDPEALKRFQFSIGKSAYQKLTEIITLDDAREANADDEIDALATLLNDGYRKIRLVAGKGSQEGAYHLGAEPWTNPEAGPDFDLLNESPGNIAVHNLHLFGDGMHATVVKQNAANYCLMGNSLSPDPADSFRGLHISDMTLLGDFEAGFDNNIHLIALHGFIDPLIERVFFKGPRSDAGWFAHGPKPTTTRYNEGVVVRYCRFDGITKDNRNALSFENANGFLVEACLFERFSRFDQPGCIDIEPFQSAYPDWVVRDGIIRGNKFRDFNGGALCVFARPSFYTNPAQCYQFINNFIQDGIIGLDNVAYGATDLPEATIRQHVIAAGNIMHRVTHPMRTAGGFGIDYKRNRMADCDGILLGISGDPGSRPNREVSIEDNDFIRCGSTNGAVLLQDQDSYDCSFSRNRLIDCGAASGSQGWAFLAREGEIGVRVNDNRVRNINGRMKAFAQRNLGPTSIGVTAQKLRNELLDAPMISEDNFNPPAPALGRSGTGTTTGVNTIAAGASAFFDITVPGASSDSFWKARLSAVPGPSDAISTSAAYRAPQVVRVIVSNRGGASYDLPDGTVISVQEDF